MQNVKMAFLFRPFQPAFKMSSVAIKFAYNCEIIPVKTSKDYNSNLSTHPRKTCANVNMEGTPYVLHKARVAHFVAQAVCALCLSSLKNLSQVQGV